MNEAFMATDDTLFDEWGYDEYRKNHPPPRLGAPKKLYERWERRYVRWIEKNAPPWVWSTTKTVWDGLSASEIREQAANGSCNHEFDLDAMMEHEFTEFHDEALDQVNDLHEAATVIDEWLPHAGSGNEIDIALETKIAAWNAKQDIVTWFENKNIIRPAFRGKTQKDAVIWAGKRLKTLKRAQRNKQTRPLRHKPG